MSSEEFHEQAPSSDIVTATPVAQGRRDIPNNLQQRSAEEREKVSLQIASRITAASKDTYEACHKCG